MGHGYAVIGLMSGTSLDGLDMVHCFFTRVRSTWRYHVTHAETLPYPKRWLGRLSGLENATALDLAATHVEYGRYLGEAVGRFVRKNQLKPSLVASHGHTVFHRPEQGLTLQIGDGAAISARTGLPVVSDFRSLDVGLGGQGAPLVPAGDRFLFGSYDYCLNLGGFANVSYERRGRRIAHDICPVNMVLNRLSGLLGRLYDPEGTIAASGRLDPSLLAELDGLSFYRLKPPKSLGKEWVLSEFWPVVERHRIPVEDKLHTVSVHAARSIAAACSCPRTGTVLVTGGGAWNTFLVEMIRSHSPHQFIIPEPNTVNFKEAVVFAFLGLLRVQGEINVLASATGARADHSGGALYAGLTNSHEIEL